MLDVGRSGAPRGPASLKTLDYAVLQQCMHCGLCLPSCPTFAETGRERHSPRGRISLMRAIADGELALSREFAEEMSYCLGCLACTSACPAGVDYATMFETARAEGEAAGLLAAPGRGFIRWFTMRFLFVHPRALRAAGRVLWLYQASGLQTLVRKLKLTALLPRRIRDLEPSTPTIRPHFSDALIEETEPARGPKRYRVALLTGCVADLVLPEINRATVDVLRENGCEVVTPRAQHCCGSLHSHNGDPATARLLARKQLDAIDPAKFDAIISNAGGCGSHLKHYDQLLADDPAYAERAAEWSRKVRDVSEWLVAIGFRAPRVEERPTSNIEPPTPNSGTAAPPPGTSALDVRGSMFDVRGTSAPTVRSALTYHESCHLCHGQKVSAQPRAVLKAIPGIELRECTEATWCCGSAGVYSLTQPETAQRLLARKVGHLQATGASVVATANPGCHLQLQNGLARAPATAGVRVVHPVVLLAEAYRAERRGT